MKVIADSKGDKWELTINVDAVRRVKAHAGVDLFSIVQNNNTLLVDLADNVMLLAEVGLAILRPLIEKLGLTDDQFYERMDGAALGQLREAITGELADFFQSSPEKAAHLRRANEAINQARQQAAQQIAALDVKDLVANAMSQLPQ